MNSIEDGYKRLAIALLDSADMPWDELIFQSKILAKECSSMTTTLVKGGNRQSIGLGFKNGFQANDAALFLRDHLLTTTGQRIWGLTFTLYPNGKFNIEYDYSRPDWYTEQDEQADIVSERADRETMDVEALGQGLNSLGIEVEIHDPIADTEAQVYLRDAQAWLQKETARLGQSWGLGNEAAWNLDMNAGTLCFTFADGRQVICPVQIIGTWNTTDSTFLWGWDHPSVPDPLRRAAQTLREYGKRHSMEQLTTRNIVCTEADAWGYTAVAARLDGSIGAYRGRAGDAWVFMCFKEPEKPKHNSLLGKLFGR